MVENHISGNQYSEHFCESSKEKCTAFLSMAWPLESLIVHENTIKTYSTILQAFSSRFLSLCILHFLFHKGKNTSAILQPTVHHLVYVSPIFFSFHK